MCLGCTAKNARAAQVAAALEEVIADMEASERRGKNGDSLQALRRSLPVLRFAQAQAKQTRSKKKRQAQEALLLDEAA